ncbi:acyl-CoA dehydrogenase [Jannaschia sp. W003]|uniref:acyl-CoA dehydrogenase n=1 Tax=Jannaschia sp. W003 TaxID=2867012 RepID=UPI0021A7F3D8|nr:acyl-CoA dehydrogenase [Jannaschia sp. W003]UWQ19969.1 acyl-CoA dehydrogenase [Jannaschia sp. W003]
MHDGSSPIGDSAPWPALREAAAAEDRGAPIAASVDRLLASGELDAEEPRALAAALVAVAECNLPLARLAEGHVNAIRLVRHFGGTVRPGLHGVWGADADAPCTEQDGRLRGTKRFASGLGTVARALVTVGEGDTVRLAAIDASDPARHRPAAWDMLGMRATVSGEIVLDGLRPEWLGGPGDYLGEPRFVGGVWRIAALQLGGTLGLLGAARDRLAAMGRMDADAQVARLAPLVARAMAAFGLVERAAETEMCPGGTNDPDRAVMLSIQARLLTEDLAQDAVAATERAIGLQHFAAGCETGRRARDLATYCRQAARDAFEQRAGRIALGRGPLSELWHG